jgi:two-component system, chemotaxis family, CheB/CheR fusion protein
MGTFIPPQLESKGKKKSVSKAPIESKPQLRELTEQILLQDYAPVGVLVNQSGDILYIHGRTGMYLEPAPGVAVARIIS